MTTNVQLPRIPTRTVGGMLVHSQEEGIRRIREAAAAHRPALPKVAKLVTLDEKILRDINPMIDPESVVPFWGPLPTIIRQGDVEIARLEHIGDARPTHDLCAELRGLAADSGVEDDLSETSEDHVTEGEAAVRAILRFRPELTGIRRFSRPDLAVDMCAVDEGRAWGLSAERIAALVGHAVTSGRRLKAPCSRARELEAAARIANEKIEQEAQAAQRAYAEANRVESRTIKSLGLQGLQIDFGLPGVSRPAELGAATWIDNLAVWRSIPGISIPQVKFAVGSTLDPNTIVTANAAMLASVGFPDIETYGLVVRILQKYLPDRRTGPVDTFSKVHLEAARECVRPLMPYVYSTRTGLGYMPRLVTEIAVRGFMVSPPAAVALIWSELLDQESMSAHRQIPVQAGAIGTTHPPIRILQDPNMQQIDKIDLRVTRPVERTYAGATSKDQLASWAAEAASGGIVEVGSLLSKKGK